MATLSAIMLQGPRAQPATDEPSPTPTVSPGRMADLLMEARQVKPDAPSFSERAEPTNVKTGRPAMQAPAATRRLPDHLLVGVSAEERPQTLPYDAAVVGGQYIGIRPGPRGEFERGATWGVSYRR